MMESYGTDQKSSLDLGSAHASISRDSSKKLQEPTVGPTMKNNNSNPSDKERDTGSITAKPKKNKRKSRKNKKTESPSATEENLAKSSSKLPVTEKNQARKKNRKKCKSLNAKKNVPNSEVITDREASILPTKYTPATPYHNESLEKSSVQEEYLTLNYKTVSRTASLASRDAEYERLESCSEDFEDTGYMDKISWETNVSTTDKVVNTLENHESNILDNFPSTGERYCENALDDEMVNDNSEAARISQENPRQNFFPPTATKWTDSNTEPIEGTKPGSDSPIVDNFSNRSDFAEDLNAFKAETASIFQPDEGHTISTSLKIQLSSLVTKEAERNLTDNTADGTKILRDVGRNDLFVIPPVATAIDTIPDENEYEKAHNFNLVRSLNNGENPSEASSMSANSDQEIDMLSDTHTTEPDTPTHFGIISENIYAKKSQQTMNTGFNNMAEPKVNVISSNSPPSIDVEESSCTILTSFGNIDKSYTEEKFVMDKVYNKLVSEEILNEENESEDKTDYELIEKSDNWIISNAEAKKQAQIGLESDVDISMPPTSDITVFDEIDLKKRCFRRHSNETEFYFKHEQANKEKIPQIDFTESLKISRSVSMPSEIYVASADEAAQKETSVESNTQDIRCSEENENHTILGSTINPPDQVLSHLTDGSQTQAYIHETGNSENLNKLEELKVTKAAPSANSACSQLPTFPDNTTVSTIEPSIIEQKYITPIIPEEEVASILKSKTNEERKENYENNLQVFSDSNTSTCQANFDSKSDLKRKENNIDSLMRIQSDEEKEVNVSEAELNNNIHNMSRPTGGEQTLAPELVIISKDTLNHLHKSLFSKEDPLKSKTNLSLGTASMQAEISRLSMALNNQNIASESKIESKDIQSQKNLQIPGSQENDAISVNQSPKLAEIKPNPRTKSLWKFLWPFGRKGTENNSKISPKSDTRLIHSHPQASIGKDTEPLTSREIKRYKVVGRVRAKDVTEEGCI